MSVVRSRGSMMHLEDEERSKSLHQNELQALIKVKKFLGAPLERMVR